MKSLGKLNRTIITCKECSGLVKWCRHTAKNPPRRYQGENYWAKPLPSFGDPNAMVLIVGLALAANGANRTGRMFT